MGDDMMRTLDSDLQKYLELVPDDVLKMFAKYEYKDWNEYINGEDDTSFYIPKVMESVDEVRTFTGNDLQKISNQLQAEGKAVPFKDFKDENADPTENEKHMLKNGFERRIPDYDVQYIARSTLLLRYGEKFSQLSVKNMEKNIINCHKKYGIEDDARMDLKYKISGIQKKGIRNIIKCKVIMKNNVKKMDFAQVTKAKNSIQALRNGAGRKIFPDHYSEMEYVSNLVFGDSLSEDDVRDICNLASIAEMEEIISERLQVLEKNRQHIGLMDKIKAIFQRNKIKYLPEAQFEEPSKNEHNEYAQSIHVEVPNNVVTQSVQQNNYKVRVADDLIK